MPRTVPTVQHRRWGRLPMNTSTTCYFDNWEDLSHPSPSLESYAREQPSFNPILVEQLPQPFLNAGRSVFAQEFEHQAVERLHASLKRLVAHPQHVALNALHVVHYASLTKPGHATIKPVLRICLEAAAAEVAIGPISGIVDDGPCVLRGHRDYRDEAAVGLIRQPVF
jgi:hypothetical protein